MISTNHRIPILFVHYGSDWIRGSERCLLDLLSHLDPDKFTAVVWCNSDIMASAVKRLGVNVVCQPFPLLLGWRSPVFDVVGYLKLIKQGEKLVDQYAIQIIHSNSGAPCQWLNIVARQKRLPLLAHLHCRYPLRDRITLGLHHVSQLIAVSNPVAMQYANEGVDSSRIKVIANGIDKKRLEANSKINVKALLKLTASDFVLCAAGSLIDRKGMDVLIDALAQVRKKLIPAKLIIVGDGPCKPLLESQINELSLTRHVFLLGERDDLASLLRGGVDIFLSGAREEVFGLVLAEAGLSELPVIAPDVGGIPEVVLRNKTGLLVPPESPVNTAQAIELLYQQPHFRRQLGRAAKQRIEQLFLIEKNVECFESCYLKMINTTGYQLTWWCHWSFKPLFNSVINFIYKKLNQQTLIRRFSQREMK